MKLFIKNMVCDRCIMVVRQQLEDLNYEVQHVKLGEAVIDPAPDKKGLDEIRERFMRIGFELLEDKKKILSEKIKVLLVEKLQQESPQRETNLSHYLSGQLGFDYHYMSHVFSEIEKTTIEKFFIQQKIEKVKELIRYDELSISEIAWKLGYSSIQALSSQFKKVTGVTPSEFRNQLKR
ncbi:MAG TPA: AraC family transcriptional regulator [Cytophagaceae bacterium]|nr:AraC family transcriptional regulator [Cytophagaceae bacterium]